MEDDHLLKCSLKKLIIKSSAVWWKYASYLSQRCLLLLQLESQHCAAALLAQRWLHPLSICAAYVDFCLLTARRLVEYELGTASSFLINGINFHRASGISCQLILCGWILFFSQEANCGFRAIRYNTRLLGIQGDIYSFAYIIYLLFFICSKFRIKLILITISLTKQQLKTSLITVNWI